jgi:hypothetical protein
MSRCEQCGVAFAIPGGVHEVTTCRILCPACHAPRAQRAPAARVGRQHAAHRRDRMAHGGQPPAPGSVGDAHRRRVRERLHRQTILGIVALAGMLVLGATAALIRF